MDPEFPRDQGRSGKEARQSGWLSPRRNHLPKGSELTTIRNDCTPPQPTRAAMVSYVKFHEVFAQSWASCRGPPMPGRGSQLAIAQS